MDYISVRERGSVSFVERLSGKDVVYVCDPTYLVDKSVWYSILERIRLPEKYIFVYIPNGMNDEMLSILDRIKKLYTISEVLVIMTRGKNLYSGITNLKLVSVGQFLYLIKNASCVLTSSFHAVVFSTIFHTDFYCYDVPNYVRGEDIRLIDILGNIGLTDRLIDSELPSKKRIIEWADVDACIDKEKQKSMAFLKTQLLGEKNG